MARLKQDFETEIEDNGFYDVVPNLILVKDTNKEEIVSTINKLFKESSFFMEIKPESRVELNSLKKIQ